jgi:hypothetical protein
MTGMDVLVATISVASADGGEAACYAFPLPSPVATVGNGPAADLRLPVEHLGAQRVRIEQGESDADGARTVRVVALPGEGTVRCLGAPLEDDEPVTIGLPATLDVEGVLIGLSWVPEPSISQSLSLPPGAAAPPFGAATAAGATPLRSTDVASWIAAQAPPPTPSGPVGVPRRSLERIALVVALVGVFTAVLVLVLLLGGV